MRKLLPIIAAIVIVAWRFGFDTLFVVFIFIGILLFLVVAHELGHFTVAKLSGIKVLEFGVGIPPRAWVTRRGETEYSVNWLPMGGFVRMLGEEDPTDKRSFASQNAFKRLAVLVAGPGVNAVLPVILLTIALMIPRDITVTDVTVLSVVDGSPAAAAGVQPGDVIREAAGRDVDNSTVLRGAIQVRLGGDMDWIVERDGSLVSLRIAEVRVDPPEGQGATGITLVDARVSVATVGIGTPAGAAGLQPGDQFLRVAQSSIFEADHAKTAAAAAHDTDPTAGVPILVMRDGARVELTLDASFATLDGYTAVVRPAERRSDPIWEAVPNAFVQLWDILVTFRNEISRMLSGTSSVQISGPVGIARITGEVADAGLSPLIVWTALLSINLAIINLLPIPALDGGRITFVLIELARGGRRIAPEKERMAHLVGFALLMSLIALVMVNDIQRWIGGAGPFG
jgi:regulator of sigma E protease